MGGRSTEFKEDQKEYDIPERFSWVTELSDSRLQRYEAWASSGTRMAGDDRSIEQQRTVGYYVGIEKKRRGL